MTDVPLWIAIVFFIAIFMWVVTAIVAFFRKDMFALTSALVIGAVVLVSGWVFTSSDIPLEHLASRISIVIFLGSGWVSLFSPLLLLAKPIWMKFRTAE